MSQDVYFRLGERLNHYAVKMLLVEPFLNILREIYDEKEAELGAEFPMGGFTASELAEKLGREEGALTELLERMADKGLIFVTKTEGVSRYALTPFVPGVKAVPEDPRPPRRHVCGQAGRQNIRGLL